MPFPWCTNISKWVYNQLTDEEKRQDNIGSLDSKYWKDYLTDPFSSRNEDSERFTSDLTNGLFDYIKSKIGKDTAENQYRLAINASNTLSQLINEDKDKTEEQFRTFKLFLEFSYEIFDRFGRLLCYAFPKDMSLRENGNNLSYNEIMLHLGIGTPYFIFPNTHGFRDEYEKINSLLDIIPDVRTNKQAFYDFMQNDFKLQQSIAAVRGAKKLSNSVWKGENALRLLPFELRYIQRRQAPDRYVMDLSEKNPIIYSPTEYHSIRNEGDRFFIPYDYLPLFERKGYDIR